MTEDLRKWLNDILDGFVQESPENSLKMDPDERAFDEILVGFSSGADPLYNDYKELIGPFHWTPLGNPSVMGGSQQSYFFSRDLCRDGLED